MKKKLDIIRPCHWITAECGHLVRVKGVTTKTALCRHCYHFSRARLQHDRDIKARHMQQFDVLRSEHA